MAVTQPNITVVISENTGCSGLSLTDTTGIYNGTTNTTGYGLPSGPAVADVDTVTIKVTLNALEETYFLYTFTTAAGVITAATLSLNGATAVNILSSLPSTVWPFSTAFDLYGDYGVTLPTLEDDVVKVEYTVEGTVGVDDFTFENVTYQTVLCSSRCCIDKKFADLDINCDCNSEAFNTALYGETLIKKATYSAQYGDLSGALEAITELKKICNDNCGCGC